MTKKYSLSLFIFRRDFRIIDNLGLINALKDSNLVIPIFIFTPEQLVKNKYKSNNSVQFMIESLKELDKDLKSKGSKIFYFYGNPEDVVQNIINNNNIDCIYVNTDYTPYSVKRDDNIKNICVDSNINFVSTEDVLLNPVKSILTKTSNKVYQKFTPYFNSAKKIKINSPKSNKFTNYYSNKKKILGEYKSSIDKFYIKNKYIAVNGGRINAIKILNNIEKYKKYNKERNNLNINTTKLSAYIKFGCVSIREVYHAFKKKLGSNNDLIKQLYWRDFYYNISFQYPRVFNYSQNLKKQYNAIQWNNNNNHLNKWKKGETGFPAVDASMREMNKTGFMHNRGRLITSNFLIKILGINWKLGEKYFAQKLVDYDPSVNNGNWAWSSGSGADSQPYFRVFNPWLQSEKFDAECAYIKKWIPELANVHPSDIHSWYLSFNKYKIQYNKPIVDYKTMKIKTMKIYKKALDKSK